MSANDSVWWKKIFRQPDSGQESAALAEPAGETAPKPAERRSEPRWPAFAPALLEWIDTAEEDQSLAVHVVERSESGLAVRSPRRLEPGWPVLVTLASESTVRGVVRNVSRDDDGWRLGIRLILDERRRFDRRPAHGSVRVTWQDADGRRREEVAALRDVGEGGVRLAMSAAISPGVPVVLHSDGVLRFGTVVQSAEGDRLYEYGVQFTGPPIADRTADYRG